MSRRRWIAGAAVAAAAGLAGGVAGALFGSRPDGIGADGPLAPCGPALNCYRTRRAVGATPEAALDAAEAVLRETASESLLGSLRARAIVGRVISVERTPSGLQAVAQVGPFRDDIAVAAVARDGFDDDQPATLLYVRSASRSNGSDLGVNRRRGEWLLDAVEARLTDA